MAIRVILADDHQLVRAGLRVSCDLVAETGEARDVHHLATLLGFGVNGLTLWGVPYWINDVFFGASLVIAVAISSTLGRHRAGTA